MLSQGEQAEYQRFRERLYIWANMVAKEQNDPPTLREEWAQMTEKIEPRVQEAWRLLRTKKRKIVPVFRKLAKHDRSFLAPFGEPRMPPLSPENYVAWLLEEAATETALRARMEGEGKDAPDTQKKRAKLYRDIGDSAEKASNNIHAVCETFQHLKTALARLVLFNWEMDPWDQSPNGVRHLDLLTRPDSILIRELRGTLLDKVRIYETTLKEWQRDLQIVIEGVPQHVACELPHNERLPGEKGKSGRRAATVLGTAVVKLVQLFLPIASTEYAAYKYSAALLYVSGAIPSPEPKDFRPRYKELVKLRVLPKE